MGRNVSSSDWFPTIAVIVLVMVDFLLGEHLTLKNLRQFGRDIVWASIEASVGTSVVVTVILVVTGVPVAMARLLPVSPVIMNGHSVR